MKYRLYTAWLVSLLASLASIYFIEILKNPAATLCWFERMLMFGIFLILTVGIIRKDVSVRFYTIPFLILGIPSALFQQLVHWGIIHLAIQSCSVSTVCTTKFFNLFGFITQATLCLSAFLIIALVLWSKKIKSS